LALDVPRGFLWRWTPAADRMDKVMPVDGASAMAVTAGGVLIAYDDGHVAQIVEGHETRRFEVGQRTEAIAVSPDRRWAALQLESGATVIADATTATVVQRLGGGDTSSVEPSFDDTGELLIRPLGGIATIWDRTTGLPLVSNLDLLHVQNSDFVFGAGGRLELQGDVNGVL